MLCLALPEWPREYRRLAPREAETEDAAPQGPPPLDDAYARREALRGLAEWCGRFSPCVGLEEAAEPQALLLEIGGCAHLFGGERRLAETVAEELKRRGLHVRAAVAGTVGAAWAAAHFACEPGKPGEEATSAVCVLNAERPPADVLGRLPLAALRLAPATIGILDELGIETVAGLLELPRAALPGRFGPELLRRIDQFLGHSAEVVTPVRPPAVWQAAWPFETPVRQFEAIAAAMQELIEELAARLQAAREGALAVGCWLDLERGPPQELSVRLFRPSDSPRHLGQLLGLRAERLRLREGVCGLRLELHGVGPLPRRQRELFDDLRETPDAAPLEFAQLIDRLSSRLGREAVLQPQERPDAQPERAFRLAPLVGMPRRRRAARKPAAAEHPGGAAAGEGQGVELGALSGAGLGAGAGESDEASGQDWSGRPLWCWPRPRPIEVWALAPDGPPLRWVAEGVERRVARSWGPERIETGWWRGRSVRRDYYRVETDAGQRFWLFRRRNDGRWFLHGAFE